MNLHFHLDIIWKRIFALTLLVILAAIALFVCYSTTNPEGVYCDKDMANVGPAYWVIKGGNITIITQESTDFITTYSKVGNEWVYDTRGTNGEIILRPSVLGIKMINPLNHSNDIFIPRRYFSWLF